MLDPFPFSEEEWARVCEASTEVVNATLMDDFILQASKFIELQLVLESLRDVHGEHPILIETEADFADDPAERSALYLRALDGAMRENIPTYTIRISYADVLLECFADPQAAREQLAACEKEVNDLGDEWDRNHWRELLQNCRDGQGARQGY